MEYAGVAGVGRNKTTHACPELVEGRSARWRFRLVMQRRAGNASSRLRSKRLIPAYRTAHLITLQAKW